MLSLLDLYNMREGKQPGSDLLEFYQGNGQAPEPQLIDRFSMLPIGQYEDRPVSRFANADPAYDANALVDERWRDKPRIQGEPSSYGFGYIEPPAVFQQERIDRPSMWFRPQPIPPPPLFK